MRRYIIKRILQMIPTILAILLINFLLIRLAPGDPARVMAGEMATPENVEAIRERFGLDRSLAEQMVVYVQTLLQGDFGYSYNYLVPVSELILGRLPQTLLLVLSANILSIVLGTIVGAYSASRFPSRTDSTIWISSLVFYSMPIFWFGMLLVFVFSRQLGWLPSGGMYDIINRPTGWEGVVDRMRHAILPILTLMAYFMPIFIRITRASVIETLGEDYITTVRAVGLSENRIFMRHALRNALLPTVTMAGLTLGFVVTGAVLTETVFGWPGVGLLFWQAITNRDYPVLMGIFVFTSVTVVLASFVTDLVYAMLDPRVRFENEQAA
jgi:ABC-type dipeptide/oligopeptide/nickel transport system permease component